MSEDGLAAGPGQHPAQPGGDGCGGRKLDRRIVRFLQWATIFSPETWALGMLALLIGVHLLAWAFELPPHAATHLGALTGVANLFCTVLIIRSQRAIGAALQLKLGSLIAASEGAANHLVAIEEADEATIERLRARLMSQVQQAGSHEAVQVDSPAAMANPGGASAAAGGS